MKACPQREQNLCFRGPVPLADSLIMNNRWTEWKHFFGIIRRIIARCLNQRISAGYSYFTRDEKGPQYSILYYGTEAV
jgi:hypothetical protein